MCDGVDLTQTWTEVYFKWTKQDLNLPIYVFT